MNHRKKTKADGSRLIPRKHTETLVLLSMLAAINTKQPGGANNEKLKLETLVRSDGANLQAIIHIKNQLFTDEKG